MSNFDITELLTDGQTDGQMDELTDGRKSGRLCRKVRELFHARFDGRLVL